MIPHIRQILQMNEKLNQEAAALKGVELGTVKIGTFLSVSIQWLPSIIKDFHSQCPSIELKLLDGNHDEMEERLMEGSIDLGFITLPTRKSFHVVPLKRDRMMCIFPAGHRFEHQTAIRPDQLIDEPFIIPVSGCDSDIQRIFAQNQLKPKVKYDIEGDQAIIAMVQCGLGISILPEMNVSELPDNVCYRPLEGEYCRSIGIAIALYDSASPAAKKVFTLITQWLSQQANHL